MALAVILLLTPLAETEAFAGALQQLDWQELERAWDKYHSRPTADNAEQLYSRLPVSPPKHGGYGHPELMEKFYSALDWLQPRILGGDRWATRIAFRLCAVADAAFSEDLEAMLASMIRRQPLLFLEELRRNRKSVGDITTVVLNLNADEFLEAPSEIKKAELQARLDALGSVSPSKLELMNLRDECRSLLGEEITHGFGEE